MDFGQLATAKVVGRGNQDLDLFFGRVPGVYLAWANSQF